MGTPTDLKFFCLCSRLFLRLFNPGSMWLLHFTTSTKPFDKPVRNLSICLYGILGHYGENLYVDSFFVCRCVFKQKLQFSFLWESLVFTFVFYRWLVTFLSFFNHTGILHHNKTLFLFYDYVRYRTYLGILYDAPSTVIVSWGITY